MGSFCFVIDERTLLRSNLGVWVDRASGNRLHYRRQKINRLRRCAQKKREDEDAWSRPAAGSISDTIADR